MIMANTTIRYANTLADIVNAFGPEPLDFKNESEFYCPETMAIRTGDPLDSPIDNLISACQQPENDRNAWLFVGHKGCGKSTELNRLKKLLEDDGQYVEVIKCALESDMQNLAYWDLLILIVQGLFKIAKDVNCDLDKDILNEINEFWKDIETVSAEVEATSKSIKSGADISTPKLLSDFLDLFFKIKGELKYSDENRKTIREKVERRSSTWIGYIQYVADKISIHSGWHKPVIIFEDLDKMNPKNAWEIFFNYASTLSQMPFPVIYTFPIGLTYDPRCALLDSYFNKEKLPMIKIRNVEGAKFDEGIESIRKIVEKRADLNLIEQDALTLLIEKTGGSLRDLFNLITDASRLAKKGEKIRIELKDAQWVIIKFKSDLTRRIEKRNYAFLVEIYKGNKKQIEDKEMLLEMMQASAVLEYNGERWHDLHPLIADFLIEEKLVEEKLV
jgi:energy-coupling factor transporter ATP-binding protein EcfA2